MELSYFCLLCSVIAHSGGKYGYAIFWGIVSIIISFAAPDAKADDSSVNSASGNAYARDGD